MKCWGYVSHEYLIKKKFLIGMIWKTLAGGNLEDALAPTLYLQYPREFNMCNTSGWGCVEKTRAQGLKIKHSRYNVEWELIWSPKRNANLEIVFLGFASHDYVECFIRVFGATLNTAGHVLLILVWIKPHTERSVVSFQLGLWFRTYTRVEDKIYPLSRFYW